MADIFQLSDILPAATQAIDSIINQLGKQVTLNYPSRMVFCANCNYDPIGKKSGNVYKDGGPIPFSAGQICPECQGQGMFATETTDTIKLLIQWDYKEFFLRTILNEAQVKVPDGSIEVKGYVTDLSALQQAESVTVEQNLMGGIKKYKFRPATEPIDPSNIIQGRYFLMLMVRVG